MKEDKVQHAITHSKYTLTLLCYLIQYPTAELKYTHGARKGQDILKNNFVQLTKIVNNRTVFRYSVFQFHCILSQSNNEQLFEYFAVIRNSYYGIRRLFYNITHRNV
jgi:hypothetical protein